MTTFIIGNTNNNTMNTTTTMYDFYTGSRITNRYILTKKNKVTFWSYVTPRMKRDSIVPIIGYDRTKNGKTFSTRQEARNHKQQFDMTDWYIVDRVAGNVVR